MKINVNENETKKPIFYVFSGIEKTLMGKDFINSYYNGHTHVHGFKYLDPDCVEALDYLLEKLEEKYDTRLVITSKRRENQRACEIYLKQNNLKYNKPIFFTKFVSGPRGEKIVDFLEQEGATPLAYHTSPLYVRLLKYFKDNPDFKNYVVLEGANKGLSKYIPKQQLKKINSSTGFNKDTANDILIDNGIIIVEFDMDD